MERPFFYCLGQVKLFIFVTSTSSNSNHFVNLESPKQRRRTQIRIAQRAYRDRKDQVIIRLEDEVEKLKKTKDDYFQGVVDIVKLFRSNDMMNSQAGLEFSHRFQDIIDRICRINAGERGELASVD